MAAIEVISPTGPATARTTDVLFRPFRKKLWLAMALAAGLTLLGDEFSIDTLLHLIAFAIEQARGGTMMEKLPTGEQALAWLQGHLTLFIVYMFAATLVATVFYVLYRWLNCRAQFVMFDYAAKDGTEFKASWRQHKKWGNSYLRLRIWWDLILFNIYFVIFILAAVVALPDWKPIFSGVAPTFSGWSMVAIVLAVVLSLMASVIVFLLGSLVHAVVPALMFQHGLESKAAFKLARKQFRMYPKAFIGFFLLLILAQSAKRLLMLVALFATVLVTCTVAFFLALVPVVGAPVLYPIALGALPVIVWERVYMLEFAKQLPVGET